MSTLIDRGGDLAEINDGGRATSFDLDGMYVYIVLDSSNEITWAFAQPLDGSGDPSEWPYWKAEA